MKFFLSTVLFFYFSFCSLAQNGNNSKELTKSFLNDVVGERFKNSKFVISNRVDSFTISAVKKKIKEQKFSIIKVTSENEKDTVVKKQVELTDDEIKNINENLISDNQSWLSFLQSIHPNIEVLSQNSIKDCNTQTIYQITQPFFLKNNSLCLFIGIIVVVGYVVMVL